jgi:tetratricopeptide (TPR) repeat protein
MNKKIFLLMPVALFLLAGCSSSGNTTENSGTNRTAETKQLNKKGFDSFINGVTEEMKGDYSRAILEYQDALQYEQKPGIYNSLAKNYLFLNKLSLALQNSRKAVEMEPDNIEFNYLLAQIYSMGKVTDSAEIILKKIIELDSTELQAYYKLAQVYETNRPLQAIEIYNKLLKLSGSDWSVLIRITELYERLGNIDLAIKGIEDLRDMDPSNLPLQKLLGEYYAKGKKYDKAMQVFDDIIQQNPDELDIREKKAQLLIEQNKWPEASEQYDYILSQPDVALDIKTAIGAAFFDKALKDSSLIPVSKKFFEKLDKDTSDWGIKIHLAAISLILNDSVNAKTYIDSAAALNGYRIDWWIKLCGSLFDNRKYREAVIITTEALKKYPGEFALNIIMGLALGQNENYAEAKSYLKKAIEISPNDINALSAYGFTLNQLKEVDESIVYTKKAIQLDPTNVNLLGTLGSIYDGQKMYLECDSVYEKALAIEKANPLINNNYAYSLSVRGVQLERALDMANIAIKAEPDNSSYLDTIGWIYFKLGKLDLAKNYIEKSIKIGGEKSVILDHLGDVEFKAGNKAEAMKLWKKALNMDKDNKEIEQKIEKGAI